MNNIEELVVEKPMEQQLTIQIANESHVGYVQTILDTIEAAAKVRGTGIAKRTPEYVELKIKEGKAIIALMGDEFAGFCYIESWGNKQFVANSGLIVVEKFRQHGLAKKNQTACLFLGEGYVSDSEGIWSDIRRSGNENKYRTGVCARDFCATDR